jgi:hypothetical protein
MSLKQFVEQENRFRVFFKEPALDPETLTHDEATLLYRKIDSQLSPESLFQDGERRGAAAAKVKRMLLAAFQDLKAKGFTPPAPLYNIEA